MPIATTQGSGSDSDLVKVSSQENMNDEKPNHSVPIKTEVDIGAQNENENEKTGSIENGSVGVKEEVGQGTEEPGQEYDELEEKIEAAVKKFRQRTASVKKAAWPFAQKTLEFSNRFPVLFTFLAIFGSLSIVPIGLFIAFLLSALIVIVSTAVIGICLSTLTCILVGASILFPILVFTSIISTFILSGLICLFLVHRFYLHLRATSSSSGQFQLSVDSTLTAIVDFGIETAARVGIDIHPGSPTPKNPSTTSGTKTFKAKVGTNKTGPDNRAQVKWDQTAQEWIDRKEWYNLGRPVSAQKSTTNEMSRTSSTTSERLAALVAAKEALAALEKNSGLSGSVEMDEKAQIGNGMVIPTITFRSPQ